MVPPASPETLSAMGGQSGRLGRGLRQLKDARGTWMLLRILLAVQAIPFLWDLATPARKMYLAQRAFGLSEATYLSGSPWQPITYAFIHANWFHLLANAACILLLGQELEHIVARSTFWLLTLYTALAGGAFFLIFAPSSVTPPQILVGSSAVCFGFLILLTTLSPDSKFLPLFLSGRSIGIAIILANLALTLLNPDLPTGSLAQWGRKIADSGMGGLFQVSHACHLGGSVVGFFYGRFLLRPRVTLDSLKRAREKREAAGKPQA